MELLVLSALLGQTLFWQTAKKVSVCSPPKVGTSFAHAWLTWSEVSAKEACKYGVMQLSREAQKFCKDAGISHTESLYLSPRNDGPLSINKVLARLLPEEHSGWRMFVLARDPWSRLMSGFTNKILGWTTFTNNKYKYVSLSAMRQFLPELDAAVVEHNATPSAKLKLVLRALLKQPRPSNPHFKLQSELCFHESFHEALALPSTCVLAIDHGGFDDLSVALGHGLNGSLSAHNLRYGSAGALNDSQLWAADAVLSGRRLLEAAKCCMCIETALMQKLYRGYLAADYATLAKFGLNYTSARVLEDDDARPRWAKICGYGISFVSVCVENCPY